MSYDVIHAEKSWPLTRRRSHFSCVCEREFPASIDSMVDAIHGCATAAELHGLPYAFANDVIVLLFSMVARGPSIVNLLIVP